MEQKKKLSLAKLQEAMDKKDQIIAEYYREQIVQKLKDKEYKRQIAIAFGKLKTPKEKVLFFYRQLLKMPAYIGNSAYTTIRRDGKIALAQACALTYLSEKTDLINKDDPLALVPYFINYSSESIRKFLQEYLPESFDRTFIFPDGNTPFSEEYILQTLIYATTEGTLMEHEIRLYLKDEKYI